MNDENRGFGEGARAGERGFWEGNIIFRRDVIARFSFHLCFTGSSVTKYPPFICFGIDYIMPRGESLFRCRDNYAAKEFEQLLFLGRAFKLDCSGPSLLFFYFRILCNCVYTLKRFKFEYIGESYISLIAHLTL